MDINLLGPANQLGYGIATLNILDSLLKMDHDVAFFPIAGVSPREIPADKREAVKRGEAFAGFYNLGAPSIRIWHQNGLAEHVGNGFKIGFPFFELRELQPNELHHMGLLDLLIVASEWAADVCEAHNLPRPAVAPLGVDRDVFHEDVQKERWAPDYTVFVNVGKWEIRKGHDVLISAFNKAFGPTDKVLLKLAPANPFIGDANLRWAQKCSGSRMGKQIYVEQFRLKTQHDVARFLASADCGVFPARAEAWNLELLEAMSCGLPCIATDYSGHTQYANDCNCRLIKIEEYEDARDGVWFHGQGQWAKFGERQEEQLIEYMREVHRLKQTGALGRNVAGIETARWFSWQRTADEILEVIR